MDPFMMDFADDAAGKVRPLNGLLLGGRGLLGLAALPIVEALKEADYPMDVVVGTGGGALVAGLVGLDLPPRKIQTLLTELQAQPLDRFMPERETRVTRLAKLTHGMFGVEEAPIPGDRIPANGRLSELFTATFGRRQLHRLAQKIVFEALPVGSRRRPRSLEKGAIADLCIKAMADGNVVSPMPHGDVELVDASGKRALAVQACLRLGARRLVGIAPKTARLTSGQGGKASLDQGHLPDGVLVGVSFPRNLHPWDVTRIDEIIAAGERARDDYLDAILEQDRLAWAA